MIDIDQFFVPNSKPARLADYFQITVEFFSAFCLRKKNLTQLRKVRNFH